MAVRRRDLHLPLTGDVLARADDLRLDQEEFPHLPEAAIGAPPDRAARSEPGGGANRGTILSAETMR